MYKATFQTSDGMQEFRSEILEWLHPGNWSALGMKDVIEVTIIDESTGKIVFERCQTLKSVESLIDEDAINQGFSLLNKYMQNLKDIPRGGIDISNAASILGNVVEKTLNQEGVSIPKDSIERILGMGATFMTENQKVDEID